MEEIVGHLIGGFGEALQPINLLMLVIGCMVGLFVGALPGLGSVNGVAILLPLTFLVPPNAAIIFLAAIYYGAMYGGAISSVTLGIPGASTAVATVFDGQSTRHTRQSGCCLGDGSNRVLYRRHDFGCPLHAVCTTAC